MPFESVRQARDTPSPPGAGTTHHTIVGKEPPTWVHAGTINGSSEGRQDYFSRPLAARADFMPFAAPARRVAGFLLPAWTDLAYPELQGGFAMKSILIC